MIGEESGRAAVGAGRVGWVRCLGLASMPASVRCWAVMGVGAPVSGSKPPRVFGKAITSRIESAPASSMQTRSQPNAIPPCGGGP